MTNDEILSKLRELQKMVNANPLMSQTMDEDIKKELDQQKQFLASSIAEMKEKLSDDENFVSSSYLKNKDRIKCIFHAVFIF